MVDVASEVTTEMLQAFAEAWNRHDLDALMSFMTEDCVFEASAGVDVCGTRFTGRESVRAPASPRSGQPSPMPNGATLVILSSRSVECRSGRSREHGPTALASKSMVVTCSPFETAGFP